MLYSKDMVLQGFVNLALTCGEGISAQRKKLCHEKWTHFLLLAREYTDGIRFVNVATP